MTVTTLRLPDEMAKAIKSDAAAKGTTMNELMRSLIRDYLLDEEEKRLYDDFTLLGTDPQECDVEYAIHAASEVVLRDE